VRLNSSVSKPPFHTGAFKIIFLKQVYRPEKVVCGNPSIITAHLFFETFSKNIQISPLTKIRPVGAELFLADAQRHMTSLSKFCNCA
jgi:hypothetical protein